MKRSNPYICIAIVWAIISALCAVASVVLFVDDRLAIGLVMTCVACGFSFVTGIIVEKALRRAELNRQHEWLASVANELRELTKEKETRKESEPFKEFDKKSDLPFEEVRKKEE